MRACVRKWLSLGNTKSSEAGQFYIDGKRLEFVASYSHLGHIITNTLNDSQDILYGHGYLVGQINSVLCYFDKLDSLVKMCLLKSFCYSLY